MKKNTTGKAVQVSRDKIDRKWIDVNIPCRAACPIMTDIPGYIQAIMEGDYQKAYYINRVDNVLPGILGRVCHRPCEKVCRHGWDGLGDPVSICFLKRSAADFGMLPFKPDTKGHGKTVCIIGAGPAGLTAANDLALRGYDVEILEQFDQPGGMLRYGIPQFRLPYDLVARDIKSIKNLGVKIKTNMRIKNHQELEKLKKKFDAVILAGGCTLPKTSNIPGIESESVFWGIDFMISANREEVNQSMQKVVVVGGGFTAVDCTRMAYRLGAKQITLAYRRTQDDMYVSENEIEAMEAEGINFSFLVSPVAIETKRGKAVGVRVIHNSIEENRSISPIAGSEFVQEADTVIIAIGQKPEDKILEKKSQESEDNFFIAGDFRNGASTVIEAAADGRKKGREVHKYLSKIKNFQDIIKITETDEIKRQREYDFIPRQAMEETPLFERRIKDKEVDRGFSKEISLIESRRCYLCHYNFQIDIDRCIYCLACIEVMPVDCIKMARDIQESKSGDILYIETDRWDEVQVIAIDNDRCIRCGNCVRACPVDCISISKYSVEVEEGR